MTPMPFLVVGAALWLALYPQNVPFPTGPLRNSFATGAETFIDSADAIDLHAPDDRFAPQLSHLQNIYSQLKSMAQDRRETEVARELNDMIFAISACHIQAVGGNSTEQCEAQVAHARTRSMETLDKHKTAGRMVHPLTDLRGVARYGSVLLSSLIASPVTPADCAAQSRSARRRYGLRLPSPPES